MKVVITQTPRSQLIQRWHLAGATKRACLSETDVVEQNDNHVWRPSRSFHFKASRRLGITSVKFRDGWQLRLGNGERGPIDLLRYYWQGQQADY